MQIEPMLEALKADPSIKAVFPTNPNNPTALGGHVVAEPSLATEDVIFILDEAYKEFVTAEDQADGLALALDGPYAAAAPSPRLTVWRVCVGYGISSPDLIAAISQSRPPFFFAGSSRRRRPSRTLSFGALAR